MDEKSGRLTKIDKFNLGAKVVELSFQEGKTDTEISRVLKADGFEISQPTVTRWLKEYRERTGDEVRRILHDHNLKELPKDLDALEDMERIALAWAREDPARTAERITKWEKVTNALEEVAGEIQEAFRHSGKIRQEKLQAVIERITGWVLEDINTQKERINAMKMTASLIEIKLRYGGVIDDERRGNIIIKYSKHDDRSGSPEGGDQRQGRKFTLIGGGG